MESKQFGGFCRCFLLFRKGCISWFPVHFFWGGGILQLWRISSLAHYGHRIFEGTTHCSAAFWRLPGGFLLALMFCPWALSGFNRAYHPWNWHSTWISGVGRGASFWEGLQPGAMLVSFGECIHWDNTKLRFCLKMWGQSFWRAGVCFLAESQWGWNAKGSHRPALLR